MSTIAQQLGLLVDPEPQLSAAEDICQRRQALGRKFEPADVTPELTALARAWLLEPTKPLEGDFLLSMGMRAVTNQSFSAAMVKGVLNWASAQKPHPAAPSAKAAEQDWLASIPEGRYAIGVEARFYRVRRPKTGNWIGHTFVDHIVGSPGDYVRVPTPQGERTKAAMEIAADPLAAGLRFSQEAKACARCMAALSDEESRMRGYGPDCWKVVAS